MIAVLTFVFGSRSEIVQPKVVSAPTSPQSRTCRRLVYSVPAIIILSDYRLAYLQVQLSYVAILSKTRTKQPSLLTSLFFA